MERLSRAPAITPSDAIRTLIRHTAPAQRALPFPREPRSPAPSKRHRMPARSFLHNSPRNVSLSNP
jgi:hypothetical protein